MITRILVPLDGSVLAESALSVAAQVTRALRGALMFASCRSSPFCSLHYRTCGTVQLS